MSNQSTYPQQFEPWRPDYPQMWNYVLFGDNSCAALDCPKKPNSKIMQSKNIAAFATTNNIINRAMKQ